MAICTFGPLLCLYCLRIDQSIENVVAETYCGEGVGEVCQPHDVQHQAADDPETEDGGE